MGIRHALAVDPLFPQGNFLNSVPSNTLKTPVLPDQDYASTMLQWKTQGGMSAGSKVVNKRILNDLT